jgi:hypothetical protein
MVQSADLKAQRLTSSCSLSFAFAKFLITLMTLLLLTFFSITLLPLRLQSKALIHRHSNLLSSCWFLRSDDTSEESRTLL